MSFQQKLALSFVRNKLRLLHLLSPKAAAASAFRLFTTPQHRNTKEITGIFLQAEQLDFDFREFRIRGYRWGAGAARTALILHGFESSIVNFGQYVQPLLDRGFCVLGFDAPAHGRSNGEQMNVQIYMQFIEAIRDRFGPVTRFMGHSLGGLSLCLALEEQGGYEGARAVLIAPATETRTAIDYYFRFLRLPASMRPAFDALITERSGHPPEWFSVARVLPALQLPILWIHDQDDDLTPLSDAEPVRRQALPHVHFYITKGLGHRRIYRDPNVVERVVNFLSEA
ncbi:MAG: alpha/beta fold hydrolase [Chitinophagaceae bacterium]|nr:MAG: alpha/beta fold hydrolase [Chitinophagaceae bacterium]